MDVSDLVCVYVCVCVQHAVGYVTGDQFYGAKASLNVWPAKVASAAEFSLSQIWVISGTFGNDLNTIEAGWQVRFFYTTHSPMFLPGFLSAALHARSQEH
jgi:hypothetical protein